MYVMAEMEDCKACEFQNPGYHIFHMYWYLLLSVYYWSWEMNLVSISK
jgi:hypothetical protein